MPLWDMTNEAVGAQLAFCIVEFEQVAIDIIHVWELNSSFVSQQHVTALREVEPECFYDPDLGFREAVVGRVHLHNGALINERICDCHPVELERKDSSIIVTCAVATAGVSSEHLTEGVRHKSFPLLEGKGGTLSPRLVPS
ncbi:Hypothetical protein (plasmid) [Pseudomonas putida]|nr:Hypothetical protein [Pseudomonas putida]